MYIIRCAHVLSSDINLVSLMSSDRNPTRSGSPLESTCPMLQHYQAVFTFGCYNLCPRGRQQSPVGSFPQSNNTTFTSQEHLLLMPMITKSCRADFIRTTAGRKVLFVVALPPVPSCDFSWQGPVLKTSTKVSAPGPSPSIILLTRDVGHEQQPPPPRDDDTVGDI